MILCFITLSHDTKRTRDLLILNVSGDCLRDVISQQDFSNRIEWLAF